MLLLLPSIIELHCHIYLSWFHFYFWDLPLLNWFDIFHTINWFFFCHRRYTLWSYLEIPNWVKGSLRIKIMLLYLPVEMQSKQLTWIRSYQF